MQTVQDSRVVDVAFLGLARNCGPYLKNLFALMADLSQRGITCCALVGENGSTDDTREVLAAASLGLDVVLVDTAFMAGIKPRLERMARGRELLRTQLAERGERARWVVVIDLDTTIRERIDADQVVTAFSNLTNDAGHFAISASSRPFYYDLLAYEGGGISFCGLSKRIGRWKWNPFTYFLNMKSEVYQNQQNLTSSVDIDCDSAFNGLCVYKYEDYMAASYVESAEFNVCEHVHFNRTIGSLTGKSMVISSDLSVSMPIEHGPATFFAFGGIRLAKVFRSIRSHLGVRNG